MEQKNIFVFKTEKDLINFTTEKVINICLTAITNNNKFMLALSGGKRSVRLYRNLAKSRNINWSKTHIFLVDERFVPYDDAESNFRMIKENFLNRIDIPRANIHPIPIEKTASISSEKYKRDITSSFDLKNDIVPSFDLVLLGLGEDGHTASLFPEDKNSSSRKGLTLAVSIKKLKNKRITIALPVINNAKNIIFTITGKKKANAVKKILDNKNNKLPGARVKAKNGKLLFLLDKLAASGLKQKTYFSGKGQK